MGTPPAWFKELFSEDQLNNLTESALCLRFSYLEHFLVDARKFWSHPSDTGLESGVWTESLPDGRELQFHSIAYQVDGRSVLAFDGNQTNLARQVEILQQAREVNLRYSESQRKLDQQGILFHCMLHDLISLHSTVRLSFQLLQQEFSGNDKIRGIIEDGLQATQKQESFIKDILEFFSLARGIPMGKVDFREKVDLRFCLNEVITLMNLTAMQHGVSLRIEPWKSPTEACLVLVEQARLMRVLINLVENALRYAPHGSAITIGMAGQRDSVIVFVDDDGPGVAPDMVPTLFHKFSGERGKGGKLGIGLYFCSLTLNRWGGSIGYAPRTPTGARFWFKLPSHAHE
jgi:signal transduction histidine kinase